MLLPIIAVAVFLGVAAVAYAILDLALSDDSRVSRRLRDLSDYERAQAAEAAPLLRPLRQRVAAPAGRAIGAVAHALWPAHQREQLSARLERAGHPGGMDLGRFLAAKLMCAAGFGLLAFAAGFGGSMRPAMTVLVVAASMAFGLVAPELWLGGRVRERQLAMVRDLPDMLDMLTISVEAGLGFDAALGKLVRTRPGHLSQEFGRALQEIQAGSSRREALRHLAERMDVSELSSFTAAIIQADMFGMSIATVLRAQAGEMRIRRRQRAEELAQQAPVKMVFPLVLCILPATIIVVAGPAFLRVASIFG